MRYKMKLLIWPWIHSKADQASTRIQLSYFYTTSREMHQTKIIMVWHDKVYIINNVPHSNQGLSTSDMRGAVCFHDWHAIEQVIWYQELQSYTELISILRKHYQEDLCTTLICRCSTIFILFPHEGEVAWQDH